MKTQRTSIAKRGFTLMELMVAMAITTIIVTVLVSITSVALDTWNRSRAELRASRQAKAMIGTMASDFEGFVSRPGNTNEWFNIRTPSVLKGPTKLKSTNAAEMDFMVAATDRYAGEIGVVGKDKGGDVSCVGYRLGYGNPISGGDDDFSTFVLYRLLVNPDVTFDKLLGKDDLRLAFESEYNETEITQPENFICENIYQFNVVMNVEVARKESVGTTPVIVPVVLDAASTSKNQVTEFSVFGNAIKVESTASSFSVGGTSFTLAELQGGKLKSISLSVTVLTDFGLDQLKRRSFDNDKQRSEFLTRNSYQYSKNVVVPGS